MITVCQIAIGFIPDIIRAYMKTVRAFAERNNYQYKIITDLKDKSRGTNNKRNLCDFVKANTLANEPYTIIFDWDIVLKKSFTLFLSDNFLINRYGDNVLYNGNQIDVFKKIEQYMIEHFESEHENGMLFKAWMANKLLYTGNNILLENDTWEHRVFSSKK